jgi:hypothetical protein
MIALLGIPSDVTAKYSTSTELPDVDLLAVVSHVKIRQLTPKLQHFEYFSQ